MNKTWIQIVLVLLLSVCTACQTETPLPPTEMPLLPTATQISPTDTTLPPTQTSVPPTLSPNLSTEETFIAFCKSAVEGNLENALQLVTEDIEIIFTGPQGVSYGATHEGYSGVEELLNHFAENETYDCTVRRFEYNGDEVNLWWTHYWHCSGFKCTASCECTGTMHGNQIQKIVNNCIYEYWDNDTN